MILLEQTPTKFVLKDNASTSIRKKVQQIISIVGQNQFYLKFAAGPDAFQSSQFSRMPQFYLLILLNIETWPLILYSQFLEWSQLIIQPQLLLCMSHINFEKLTYLNLQNQFIESLEPLAWLNIPEEQTIHLQRNWLTKLKQFSKVNYKNLKTMYISQNHFQPDQIDHLTRMRYNRDEFYHLRLTNAQVNIFQVGQPPGSYQQRYCKLSSKINTFAKMAPCTKNKKNKKLSFQIKNNLIKTWSVFGTLAEAQLDFQDNCLRHYQQISTESETIEFRITGKYPKPYKKIN